MKPDIGSRISAPYDRKSPFFVDQSRRTNAFNQRTAHSGIQLLVTSKRARIRQFSAPSVTHSDTFYTHRTDDLHDVFPLQFMI